MEAWGLLTQDLMRSTGWRRWAGTALGALACWLMLLLMAGWWIWVQFKRLLVTWRR